MRDFEFEVGDYIYFLNKDINEIFIHKVLEKSSKCRYKVFSLSYTTERFICTFENKFNKIKNIKLVRLFL